MLLMNANFYAGTGSMSEEPGKGDSEMDTDGEGEKEDLVEEGRRLLDCTDSPADQHGQHGTSDGEQHSDSGTGKLNDKESLVPPVDKKN
jgi:hypothetical protein